MGLKGIIQNSLLRSAKRLEQKAKGHSREVSLRLVGLVIYLDDVTELDSLTMVKTLFTQKGAACFSCIFLKDKKMVIPEEFLDERTIMLDSNSLNWVGVVHPNLTEYFLQEAFDLIINLSKDFFFPTSYLASLAKAGIKVGRYVHPLSSYRLVLAANEPCNNEGFIHLLDSSLQFIK